ncbi:MAG: glycosyltransferase [Myxococcaceae bacterium]
MRVLHLLASPVWSGPAENVALLAAAQRALGHVVWVAVDRKRAGLSSEEPILPRLQALGLLDEGGLELSVKSSPLGMLRDARALRRRELDVVHAHFSHDHLVARFGLPRGARLVRSIHAPRSLRWSLPRADAFTVPTEADRARLPGRTALVLPPLVGTGFVPSGDRAALRRELGVEGAPLVGMVSTFQPSRRHALGLEALALLRRDRPGARLVLAGDGALEGELRRAVGRLNLAKAVSFVGYQQGEAFVRWLQALDEVWVLGLGNDYSGRAAAQARACGVRVLAVDEGGLSGLADVLLQERTPQALAAASLDGRRTSRALATAEEVAREVLTLYGADSRREPR